MAATSTDNYGDSDSSKEVNRRVLSIQSHVVSGCKFIMMYLYGVMREYVPPDASNLSFFATYQMWETKQQSFHCNYSVLM